MTVSLLLGGNVNAGSNPFDDIEVGSFYPGELITIMDEPLSLTALDTIGLELPLDLTGTDPVLVVLLDPDGTAGPEDPFIVPIRLGLLLNDPGDGGPLACLLNATDDIIAADDLSLVSGLQSLLDTLLGGLGSILNPGGDFALVDISNSLSECVITAIGVHAPELVDHTLEKTVSLVGAEVSVEAKAVPQKRQPDARIGNSGASQTHIGNDLYSAGAGQTMKTRTKYKKANKFFVSFENDGNVEDTIVGYTRTSRRKLIRSKVIDLGGAGNVTSTFKSGRYTRTLADDELALLRFVDKLSLQGRQRFGEGYPNKLVQKRQITFQSVGNTSKFDVLKIRNKFRR